MWASLRTEHGRKGRWGIGGWHWVRREAPVSPESVHVSAYDREQIEIRTGYEPDDVWVQIRLDELLIVIEALRKQGIEVDPERKRQRELVCELAQSLGVHREEMAARVKA
jgi:hypothetical protein